jgi:hypothetical protein
MLIYSIAVSFDLYQDPMMNEAIYSGKGEGIIVIEDCSPVPEGPICSDHDGATFIPAGDNLKEEFSPCLSTRKNPSSSIIKPLLNNKSAREGLGKIKAKFSTVDGIGPNWVADFLEVSDLEERARIQREVFELTNAIMEELGIEPFSG